MQSAPDEEAAVPVPPQDLDLDATAMIPRILPTQSAPDEEAAVPVPPQDLDLDATTMIPRIPADDNTSTMLIGIVPPPPADAGSAGPRKAKPGAPPVRAVRTKEGDYLSAYSDYTRVTLGSVVRGTLRTAGELMITCGLVILLFAGYEIWGKSVIVDSYQADLNQQLTQEWDRPLPTPSASAGPTVKPLPPPPGGMVGRLYIPRLGKHWVITQGVTPADIRYAPGHYPKSALPGQQGNFSMAGHRMRSVFWDLDKLQPGDKIIVETRTTWYIYAVVKSRVVKPTQVEVVSAKPPGMTPGRLITLTTCNPKWNNYQRLIIHGSLIGQQSRADGPPEEIQGA